MSKLITTSKLTRFWTKAKDYIDTALLGKANSSHTHDYAASSHSHAQAEISGLSEALAGKAASSHSHAYADLSGKPTIPTTVAQLTDAGNYALKTDIPESMDIATDAEIDAIFA